MLQGFYLSTGSNLLALLGTVSRGHELLPLSFLNERPVRWIIEAGLGPLFLVYEPREFKNGRLAVLQGCQGCRFDNAAHQRDPARNS
jgi:hypothetical protein